MRRKVQPRWGDTGVAKVSDLQLIRISSLGLLDLEIDSPAAIAKLKSELEAIGARCRMWFQQDEKGPSRAKQNAGLKNSWRRPKMQSRFWRQLDYATQGRCWTCFGHIRFPALERASNSCMRSPTTL